MCPKAMTASVNIYDQLGIDDTAALRQTQIAALKQSFIHAGLHTFSLIVVMIRPLHTRSP
jgi:hypothetical protein